MVVYSAGAGMVPKVKLRQRKYNIPTIAMHVYEIGKFAWMLWYAESRSVFLIMIPF